MLRRALRSICLGAEHRQLAFVDILRRVVARQPV